MVRLAAVALAVCSAVASGAVSVDDGAAASTALVAASAASAEEANRTVLLFAYFRQSSMSLHLAYSRDGLRFVELNGGQPVLCARRGNWSTIRDPFIHRAPPTPAAGGDTSTFHLVASAGNFGFADRFHYWNLTLASGSPVWSNGTTPEVMADVPAARCVWAPEWVYEPRKQQFLVFWASTTSQDVNNGEKRIWGRWTPDFATWPEPPFVLLDPGTACMNIAMNSCQ
jgi:hypothetical protein